MNDLPIRPLNAEQASDWLGGVVSAAQLIEVAKRRRIRHTKLPHDGAYLFFQDDLVAYCIAKDHRREAGQPQLKKSENKLHRPVRA